MSTISKAARNVSILTHRKLEVPPVPLKSIKKQNNTTGHTEIPIYQPVKPVDVVEVYEIWKVFLDRQKDNINEVYVVISGNYIMKGYGKGDWSNIIYRGFYSTEQEAQNEISAYLR